MKLIDGIPVFGEPDPGALEQIKVCAKTADYVALMADNHKGYSVPIGGVVAYRNHISPSGVGFDIACGNKAIRTDANADDIRRNIAKIMDDIWSRISFGIGQKNNTRVDHELFEDDPAWEIRNIKNWRDLARSQLGTVGSGNHYVDIFVDELDRVWIGVHFGSRGLGHKIASFFLEKAGAKDGMDVEPCVLPVASSLGADYVAGMLLAGRYAYSGRDWVCAEVARILGATILEEVHNHHNFAWHEMHSGEMLWVVRKGATPCWPGQKGFIGGSMGENAVIVEGDPKYLRPGVYADRFENANLFSSPTQFSHKMYWPSDSLYSTVHGAGRVMSRTAARGKIHRKTGRVISEGCVTREMMNAWLAKAGVVLRGGGTDESPDCYKRLPDVLAHHSDSIRILHTLRPLGVCMASPDERDPYKD